MKFITKLCLVFIATIHINAVAIDIKSNSYLLLDVNSGTVLTEKQADLQLPPASITKIMTAYIVFMQIKSAKININDTVLVSKNAANKRGSRMFISYGSVVSINDLLYGMIVSSGNDAAIALAEYISGSEVLFAKLMNETAAELGMKNSQFRNATGWPDPEHYSTASDLALLTKHLINNFPELYKIFSIKQFTYGKSNRGKPITQKNRNLLLWSNGIRADGVKTGHTNVAGYCLVGSATQDDMRLVSVVMKTNSKRARTKESEKLLRYGLQNFRTKKIFEKQQKIVASSIWKGVQDQVKIGIQDSVFLTVAKHQIDKIKTKISVQEKIIAPIKANTQVGKIQFFVDDKLLLTRPLITLESVESGGFFGNLMDSIILFTL